MDTMEDDREAQNRPWDTAREVPSVDDERTPWKLIKLLKIISLFLVFVLVFGTALCSKTALLLLITFANEGTKILHVDQKPVALLCIGCSLITPSVLLFLKSIWKACYKTSKLPRKTTVVLFLFFELLVSGGAAILTIVAMPHLDIVTNVTILNGVAIFTTLMQIISQCTAKQNNRLLLPSITALLLLLLGYILFVILYIMKDPSDTQMAIWVGLAVGASVLVSFSWWETYFKLISDNSSSVRLKSLCKDIRKGQNVLNILSSLFRIAVTAGVLGAYVPLAKMDWDIVRSIPSHETRIIAITIGVQLVSSVLCHWFAVAACKMHAMRRCFILPLYLASLAVMALFVVPVIVYYQDYRISLNGTASTNFTNYCMVEVDGRNRSLNGSVFPEMVLDVTHTLCFLDMSTIWDIGILTGSAVSWWLGLVLATLHLWYLNVFRIQRTQDLFARRLYDGTFIEQSMLLNTRFDIQTKTRIKSYRNYETVMLYLCATMWHETYDEMTNIIISIFRLDKYRPKNEPKAKDFTFEAHIYFDDAFVVVDGTQERHLNEYARNLVTVLKEVYGIFSNEDRFFKKQYYIPDQKIIRTPYGGRIVITMPQGNNIIVHFKDKDLIRHKKRWSQIMYLYYLLGFKLMAKYYSRWQKGDDDKGLKAEVQKEKHNTYILALDGDTDFQPSALMLLIDRLRMYPKVGAACGRIHPTGSGPAVWFQKFEYAVSHWLQKTAEHVIGCVLCSPGCFSLFRAEALMDDNVMKRYATKSTEASHYVQYDQGEDRWLCTLMLKQGWRVEYNAASDAYTNAPEEFKELYNQRRRWGPSTLANVVDLLGATKQITKKNPSISKLFMLYQLFAIVSAILAPATICLLIAGSLAFVLNMHSAVALVLAVIPPAIYLGLCFKLKSDIQIKIAGILSIIYAFLMLVVTMSIIGAMVKDKTILTPSSIFVIGMACIYVITAIMHPQEFHLVFYGFLYIICIPSAYLLLTIYSMVNLNNVSWGTRESKPSGGAAASPSATPLTKTQKAKSFMQRFCSWAKCCKRSNETPQDPPLNVENSQVTMMQEPMTDTSGPINTIVDDDGMPELEHSSRSPSPALAMPLQCWVSQLQETSTEMGLQEEELDKEEIEFWNGLQEKYLKPLPVDKEKQKKIASDLKDLRDKINFAFFIINALWLVATFTLQVFEASFAIKIPKVTLDMKYTGEMVQIDPIAFMFILGFATSVIIQFIAMFYHRVFTLIHFVAFLDTEPKEEKMEIHKKKYLKGKKIDSSSTADSASNVDSASTVDSSSMAESSTTGMSQDDLDLDSDESDYESISHFSSLDDGTLV